MFESVEGIFFYSFFKYVGRLCNYKFTDMLPLYFLPVENDLDEQNPKEDGSVILLIRTSPIRLP